MKDDPIGFMLFVAGLLLLVGLTTFLILLNHSRKKQAKAEQFKFYNSMNISPLDSYEEYFSRWVWVNPWDGPPFPDPSKHRVKTNITPEPDPPKTDRDFIRFGPRV